MKETLKTPELSQSAAVAFADRWKGITEEKQYADSFWSDFFRTLCGVEDEIVAGIERQKRVKSSISGNQEYIDVYWKNVALIEHKSAGLNLDKAELQARGYWLSLPPGYRPKTIIISDFKNFRLIDVALNRTHEFPLSKLPENIHRFEAIISGNRTRISQEEITVDQIAAKLMANLYLELEDHGFEGHETSVFLIRLLFLLFGDDTGMWEKNSFLKLVMGTKEDGSDVGPKFDTLFEVLNTSEDMRSKELLEEFKVFPYVNGGIFAEKISIIGFNKKMRVALVEVANYDWTTINPTIFGSLFQLIKNKEARRELGEHYTSEENINKIVFPLFLDELQERLASAWDSKKELKKLRQDLAKIKILDPACGCGNFLVVSYSHLRQLELELIVRLNNLEGVQEAVQLDGSMGMSINLNQFYGIEIEEWPAQVARMALFLTDHQANLKLERITGATPNRFPITDSANIFHENALEKPWNEFLAIDAETYILGNPPFIGYSMQSRSQMESQKSIWGNTSGAGVLDFVNNWFLLAAQAIKNYGCSAAFVSTNSIIQGTQPSIIWRRLYDLGVEIKFGHRTFAWTNQSEDEAAVHCVIIGLQRKDAKSLRVIYSYDDNKSEPQAIFASNINAYLLDAPNILIGSRTSPLNPQTQIMDYGNKPTDGGFLSNIDSDTAEVIKNSDAVAGKYLRSIMGAQEMIKGTKRYCFWLVDATPSDIANSKYLKAATAAVRDMRSKSTKANTRRDAETPSLFQEIRQPKNTFLAVPRVSSANREYIPMQICESNVITNDSLLTISNSNFITFAILESRVFTIWNATVSGRLKSDFRISAEITYNNFPFLAPNADQEKELTLSAKNIMDARSEYPEETLKTLYAPESMPPSLRKAHNLNDKNALSLFGLDKNSTDFEIISRLFELYDQQQNLDTLSI